MRPDLNKQRESFHSIPRVAVTVKWVPRSNCWQLTVAECPFCKAKHFHGGGGDSEPSYGLRASHCLEGRGQYELAPLEYDLPDEADQPDDLHEDEGAGHDHH